MTILKGMRRYKAITVVRRGKLSKSHMSDPKDGLPLESKMAQEEPVEVILSPVSVIDKVSLNETKVVDEVTAERLEDLPMFSTDETHD
jgi:hypothetical protein